LDRRRVLTLIGVLVGVVVVLAFGVLLVLNVKPPTNAFGAYDPAWFGFIGVLVGGLITGVVTVAGAILAGWSASWLDQAKRRDDRRLAREAFQRENLIALQQAILDWLGPVTQYGSRNGVALRAGMTAKVALTDEFVEETWDQSARLAVLIQRVLDESLRKELEDLWGLGTDVIAAKDAKEAVEAVDKMDGKANAALGHVGAVLRTYLVERPAA
jgi:hypothetical protein